jgi:ubiquinone/menaquinone biosynthesis C-methylase UbiE
MGNEGQSTDVATQANATGLDGKFSAWLGGLPRLGEDYLISKPRSFAHDESDYDRQYGNEPLNFEVGEGLVEVYREFGGDFSAPALEIGSGTGLMSLGLVASARFPCVILTDTSPAFLEITRKKIRRANVPLDKTAFAVLSGDDLNLLPQEAFSLVGLRSVLHHVIDVDRFVHATARSLIPGGMMIMEEPCLEGAVVMAAIAQFMPAVVKAAGDDFDDAAQKSVSIFLDTMKFYCRRDMDKSTAEDKHIFRVDELLKLGERCGLSLDYCPNRTFYRWSPRRPYNNEPESFTGFFRDYLKYCMSFNEQFMALFDKYMTPYTAWVEELALQNNGPYMHGVFVFKKL